MVKVVGQGGEGMEEGEGMEGGGACVDPRLICRSVCHAFPRWVWLFALPLTLASVEALFFLLLFVVIF